MRKLGIQLGVSFAMIWSLFAVPSAADAVDCKQASAPAVRAICGDPQLQAADAAMGEAYEKLLQAADDDADIRAMLVDSQKRWLAKRDRLFDRRLASADKDAQRAIMLSATQDRTRVLTEPSGSPPQQPALIIIAQEQRKFTGRYTGGSFAGFDTSCEFLPVQDSYVYGCFGSRQYQNYSRVCTVSRYWATGRVYEKRSVAEITDDKARVIATCSVDGVEGDTTCPGGSGEDRRWDTLPKADAPAPVSSLPKIDAEAGPDEDAPWLRTCLTDRSYPLSDPTSDGTRK
ncbi:lysozyme inhibitor LprI family protein [Vineibacter terrae]|uniref:lysozyme inhibitor LprI family protein n=1 Tax=Vineibacter terrae TaxID=2586908 RepID=UPI002E3216AF|nr:lysozyme inhibitor LprI family protein [Vineibacter terrae]